MASVQRDHWSYVVLQCLLLSLFLCRNGIFADRNKYYHISTLCVRERYHPLYKKIDGAMVTSESEDNLECVITFQTDSILQRFMLRFEWLALDCNDHLFIFDGAHAFGNHKADLSCRSTRADVGTIFTKSNFVTLKYVTDRWSQVGNGFRLIITAFKDSPIGCRDFRCLNSFCISEDLICDSINHCGDNSDETSHAFCVVPSPHNVSFSVNGSVKVDLPVVSYRTNSSSKVDWHAKTRAQWAEFWDWVSASLWLSCPARVPQHPRTTGRETTSLPGKLVSSHHRDRLQRARGKPLLSHKVRTGSCRRVSRRRPPNPVRGEWLV